MFQSYKALSKDKNTVCPKINFNCLISRKLKTTVFTRSVFIFSKLS